MGVEVAVGRVLHHRHTRLGAFSFRKQSSDLLATLWEVTIHARQRGPSAQARVLLCYIGSMCNPIAMDLREVAIVRSFAAVLHGYRRVFVTNAGWADLREDPSSSVYSVCHEMTVYTNYL